jgi:hypothetical protein
MGGFTLIGPKYIFKNTGLPVCNCVGMRKNITEEEEYFLIKNYPKEAPLYFLNKLNTEKEHLIGEKFYEYKQRA